MRNHRKTVDKDNVQTWWSGDWRHRRDGPAVIYPDGSVEYWLNNEFCSFNVWARAVKLSPESKNEMKLLYG